MTTRDLARFFSHIDTGAIAGCWLWRACKIKSGYGRMGIGSRTDGTRRLALTHRLAYEHWIGPIPVGKELDHLCRNRACANPTHLEAVSHRDNILRGNVRTATRLANIGSKRNDETKAKMRAAWVKRKERVAA